MPEKESREIFGDFLMNLGVVLLGTSIILNIFAIGERKMQKNLEQKVDQLVQKPSLELKTENVIGGQKPEKFYEFAGKRVYVEIDGQPVESYVSNRTR